MRFTGPFFIVGLPRSGTKLLRTLLNNHSQIYIPKNETNLIPLICRMANDLGDISTRHNFHVFYKSISKSVYFRNRKFDGKNNITENEWFMRSKTFTPEELFQTLIRHNIKNGDKNVIWGDKSPSYINHVTLIKHLYPEARFIHIIRDVRDYCLSINNAWGKNMLRAAYRWNKDILKFAETCTPFSNDVLELKYENLIENPEVCLKDICNFLEVQYEENMHILLGISENLGAAKNLKIIKRDNKDKYLSELNPRILNRIEGIAYNCLKKYGYSTRPALKQVIISKQMLFIYKVLDGLNLLKFYTKERGISYLFSNK